MNKFSKLVVLILCIAMMLCGCGKKEGPSSASKPIAETTGISAEASRKILKEGFSYSLYHDDNGRWEGVNASECVTMAEYKGIKLASSDVYASEEEIQEEVNLIFEDHAQKMPNFYRAAENGDTVSIDYVGSIDGVEFEGGSTGGNGTEVIIGETSYIDDFLEQIIGHKAGEVFDVEVTFPDSYPNNPDLEGKDAVFVTTLNCVYDIVVPEDNDDNVSSLLSDEYGVSTSAELHDYVAANIDKSKQMDVCETYLISNFEVTSVPDIVLAYQQLSLADYYYQYSVAYGVDINIFLSEYAGFDSLDKLYEEYKDDMIEFSGLSLIFQAIAEKENLTYTDDECRDFIREYMGLDDISSLEEQYGMGYLKKVCLQSDVIDIIMDNAVIE